MFGRKTERTGRPEQHPARYGWALLFCLVIGTASAVERPGVDAVLVIDSSGSMKTNDPKMLRVSAAKMFISLLGENDRVAVESFSGDGFPIIGLTPVRTPQDRARLLAAVDKISSRGAFTNLHAAVSRAHETLQRVTAARNRQRLVLLLTDGVMDTGDKQKDVQLTQRLQGELAAQLNTEDIALHTIAFTKASDAALLRAVSETTRARFHLAETDKDLHAIFLRFFEETKKPDMLPIDGGAFRADRSISELTVVVVRQSSKTKVVLTDPSGTRHDGVKTSAGFRWLATDHYDMITITNPKVGAWKLLADDSQSRAYVVTDMKLETDVATDAATRTPLEIRSWLTREQQTITQKEMLANTQFAAEFVPGEGEKTWLTLRDDGQSSDRANGDGIYGGQFVLAQSGTYEVRLTVRSPTFERRITRTVTVPVPSSASEPNANASPEHKAEDGKSRDAADNAEAAAPDDKKKNRKDKHKQDAEPEAKNADDSEKHAENGMNIWMLLGLFVLINLLLGGAALGFFFWYRKKHPQSKLARFMNPEKAVDADAAPEEGKA